MKLTLRSLGTGWRLGIGGVLLPSALGRGRASAEWDLISVDVFGTLVARRGDEHAAWHEGILHAAEVARSRGLSPGTDPAATRRAAERRLSATQIASGRDPEFSHQQLLEEVLRAWGAGPWASEVAAELAAWELQREIHFTYPLSEVPSLVRQWAAAGIRVVAISDTRYTARELTALLSIHAIEGMSAIYSSADEGASKFSGKLFARVAEREGVVPQRILHIGDDLYADTLSAAQRGLSIRRVQRPKEPESLPKAPLRAPECCDPAFAVGYQTLGPILVAFTRLLIDRARREGIERLAFVARDGELLQRVAATLWGHGGDMALQYLHLSRRSLACASPDLQALRTDPGAIGRILATLRSIRGTHSLLESFQNYYGAPAELISRHALRLQAEAGTERDVCRLLADELASDDLAEAFRPMRERVRRYLIQEEVLSANTALVDIGWRGSLQKIIQSEAIRWERPSPHGYYFGLWDENEGKFPERASGLISDQRRGRGLREGSSWHAAFLLEAVCRANHGIVTGFVEAPNGRVEPVHLEVGGARDWERQSEQAQLRIQNGVLAYAQWFSQTYPITVTHAAPIREAAQQRLFRLAFFPAESEREIGHLLVHSEPTSDQSALWLISKPGAGLGGWIAGLRSPWKGGYLRANGGGVPAALYCAVEGLVSQLPAGTKPAIRRLLIKE